MGAEGSQLCLPPTVLDRMERIDICVNTSLHTNNSSRLPYPRAVSVQDKQCSSLLFGSDYCHVPMGDTCVRQYPCPSVCCRLVLLYAILSKCEVSCIVYDIVQHNIVVVILLLLLLLFK